MKTVLLLVIVFCVFSLDLFAQNSIPRFDDHEVLVFRGKIHDPTWIRRADGGEYRDELNKLVDPPEVNFAGRYYIAAHSLGTGSRYYSLTDLSTGRELKVLDQFVTAEPPPKTRRGEEYLTILHYQPNSRMLVAQYLINPGSPNEKCRERVFLFNGRSLKPITKTRAACSELTFEYHGPLG